MNKYDQAFKTKYIELSRGFFSLPLISVFTRLLDKENLLSKKFFSKKKLEKIFDNKILEILLKYLESIGILKKINNTNYRITDVGNFVFSRHGAMNIIYSYKDIAINTEKILLGKKKSIYCDRIENVFGSGKSHKKKFFLNCFKILKENKIKKIIDLGLGDGKFIKYLKSQNLNLDFIGIDLSNLVIKKLKLLNKNKMNYIQEDIFKINKWAKKIRNENFKRGNDLVINFMFTFHEHAFKNDTEIKNYLNKINYYYPKAKILVTEVFDTHPKNLTKVSSSSILPEFILFHKLSKQKLFFHKQFKNVVKNSKYKIVKEIKYSQMKLRSSSSPTYSTFMLSPK